MHRTIRILTCLTITVFAPEDSFEEFSYATEHLSHDAVIDVLLNCMKAFTIINGKRSIKHTTPETVSLCPRTKAADR